MPYFDFGAVVVYIADEVSDGFYVILDYGNPRAGEQQ